MSRRQRRFNLILVLLTTALVIFAVLAARADAGMVLGMQDDESMKRDAPAYMDRMDRAGATALRLMIPSNRWDAEADAYVRAAAQAHADGKYVIVSLLSWYAFPSPSQWAAYARSAASRLAPYADAWSPMNEPNWPGMAARTSQVCEEVPEQRMSAVTLTRKASKRWRKVGRKRGTHRRIVRSRAGRMVVKFRKSKSGTWRKRRQAAKSTTTFVTTTEARRSCTAETYGRAYRGVWDAVAPVLRESDPSAALIAGDTAPGPVAFFAAFYAAGEPSVRPHVLADHYTDQTSAEYLVRLAADHGAQPWVTEWAAPGGSPAAYERGLRMLENAGVKLVSIYDTRSPAWNTRLSDSALDSVAAGR
jgi:hypothetical protein